MVFTDTYSSPLGSMTMASDGGRLTGLWFDGQKYYALGLREGAERKSLPVFADTKRWLDIYFSGKEPPFMPEIKLYGTEFQRSVWRILLSIGYGRTMTYGDIAKVLCRERGLKKMSAQAVGGAVGHNPISIIVPCHRVVGSQGSLTGYAGGVERKYSLLELEGMDMQRFSLPQRG